MEASDTTQHDQPTAEQPPAEQPSGGDQTEETSRPVDPTAAAPHAEPDLSAQVAALRQQLADIESRANSGQLTLAKTDPEIADKVAELRERFEDWPQKGGMGDDVAHPYELQEHGLPQPGVTRDYLPGGAPDELSPIVIAHGRPILQPGTAGPAVEELGTLLAHVGYPNSVSQGRNHPMAFDDSVNSAVQAFKRDYRVVEDPSQFPDSRVHENAVGPWIWEGLIRAAERA